MSANAGGDARPTVYTVPPHEPFVDALVGGILSGRTVPLDPGDPLALSRLTILLPTRRVLPCARPRLPPRCAGAGAAAAAHPTPRRHRRGRDEHWRRGRRDAARRRLAARASPAAIAPDPEARRDPRRRGADRGGERGSGRAACSGACQSAGRNTDRPDRPAGTGHACAGGIRGPLAAGAALPLAHHRPLACDPGGARPDGSGRPS